MAEDLRAGVAKAVARFWRSRLEQETNQGRRTGQRDYGGRSAVTGGRQLDGFVQLIRDLLWESGLRDEEVHVERRQTVLPGYFRPSKEWDLVVTLDGRLLATIEFKSQVGPSFGNNFNNRTEEAVGSAHDLLTAYREGAFCQSPRPWLGYLMLLEDCEASQRPVSVSEPHFPVFDEFRDASYSRRYQLLCRRLVRERLYDAACFLASSREAGLQGGFDEPDPEIGAANFAAALSAHARAHATYGR